jgi:hypothetical protein
MLFRMMSVISGLLLAVATAAGASQQPRIANATVTTQAAGAPFAASFRALVSASAEVTWIGYAVPVLDGERVMCCFDSDRTYGSTASGCCTVCRLDNTDGTTMSSSKSTTPAPAGTIKLEAGPTMLVLFRVAERKIDRVRVFSESCQLDAGGRPVRWLEGVAPADSLALLESLATSSEPDSRGRSITDGAITAIALHKDTAADGSLERLVAPSQPEAVRKKVTFWLGNARGQRGFDLLRRVIREDASLEVRKGAIFGISQSPIPASTDALVSIARADAEPRLRSEALFWLAQKAGQKVAATIAERIDQDPDTEVKKKAVFALSQLPKDEGVPLLINVARTNPNREVRKQAMFWLGQSHDSRAVDFFSEVLRK